MDLSACMNVIKKMLHLLFSKVKGSLQWILALFSRFLRIHKLGAHERPEKRTLNDEATNKGRDGFNIHPTLAASVVPSPPIREQQGVPFPTPSPVSIYVHPPSQTHPHLQSQLNSSPQSLSSSLPHVEENSDHNLSAFYPGSRNSVYNYISHYPSPRCILPSQRPRYDRRIEVCANFIHILQQLLSVHLVELNPHRSNFYQSELLSRTSM